MHYNNYLHMRKMHRKCVYSVRVFSSVSVAQRKLHRKCVYSVCVQFCQCSSEEITLYSVCVFSSVSVAQRTN